MLNIITVLCKTLTQIFTDIDKVLRGLENVISYHNVASSEDQDIRDGLVQGACRNY